MTGTVLALLLLSASIAVAVVAGPAPVAAFFPAAAAVVAAALLLRRRTPAAVEFTLWLWAVGPGLRRYVDWLEGSYDEQSPILATPAVVSLIVGVGALVPRARIPVPALATWAVIGAAGAFGGVVGVVTNGALPTAVSALLWFSPPFLALAVLAGSDRWFEHRRALLRFTDWALLLLSLYAIVQWAVAPPWDSTWVSEVQPGSDVFGRPEPFGLRVFSSVNAPFVFAHLLVWLLVTRVGRIRTAVDCVATAFGVAALGLTAVRSAWLTLLAVLVVLLVSRRARTAPVLLGGVAVTITLLLVAPQAATAIGERVSTVSTLDSDTSLLSRMQIYAEALPIVLSDSIGAGMGSTGSGSRAGALDRTAPVILDSSYLDILRTSGAVLGTLSLVALLLSAMVAWRRSLQVPPPVPAWGALALLLPIDMLLGNVTSGAAGVATWMALAACFVGRRELNDDSCLLAHPPEASRAETLPPRVPAEHVRKSLFGTREPA
jgi:hypothetical protein